MSRCLDILGGGDVDGMTVEYSKRSNEGGDEVEVESAEPIEQGSPLALIKTKVGGGYK